MKRRAFKWSSRDLSFLLIVLLCATIVVCTWIKTPIVSTFLPAKNQHLKLPPDAILDNQMRNLPSSDLAGWKGEISSDVVKMDFRDEDKDTGAIKSLGTSRNYSYLSSEGRLRNSSTTEKNETDKDLVDFKKHGDNWTSAMNETIGSENVGAVLKEPSEERKLEQGKSRDQEVAQVEKETKRQGLYADNSTTAFAAKNQVCNYAKGKWVIDDRRPLYSGRKCKQWLASMWACRLMRREDFAYEKLRWQPKDCNMEEFEGAKFLRRMQDKTLAFVGDSLGRQQFQSLMCMVTSGKMRPDVMDVGAEYGFTEPRARARPGGWAYKFPETNTTILYHWSSSLCDVEPIDPSNPSTDYAMHLDRPPAFLRNYIHKLNVLVLNTGHHWNRGKLRANRWVMHVGGAPNTNKKLAPLGNAKNLTIHSVVSWVNAELPKYPHLKAFYRTISPRHFVGGEWNTGGSCNNTVPMSIGKEVLQEVSTDYSAWSATRGTGVKLLDVTALSQVRDEGHISRFSITASQGVQDCLHWCLPGVPDTWNEILFAQI